MSDDELLSAMMDGQCTPEELERALMALDHSSALKARWSRMSLARDAMTGTCVHKSSPDFAFDVMAAIEAEDVLTGLGGPKVVPFRRVPEPAAVAAKVVAVAAPKRSRRWQSAAGLAAAASITAAVVVTGGNFLTRPINDLSRPQVAQSSSPSIVKIGQGGSLTQVATTAVADVKPAPDEISETRWGRIDSAAARQLNDFLMEHSNSRAEAGLGGSLSYARLAVRTADYRPAEEPR